MIITNDLFYNPVKSDNSILKIFYFLLKEFSILKTIFLNVFLYIFKKNTHIVCQSLIILVTQYRAVSSVSCCLLCCSCPFQKLHFERSIIKETKINLQPRKTFIRYCYKLQ